VSGGGLLPALLMTKSDPTQNTPLEMTYGAVAVLLLLQFVGLTAEGIADASVCSAW
jgi:hypothetical protein